MGGRQLHVLRRLRSRLPREGHHGQGGGRPIRPIVFAEEKLYELVDTTRAFLEKYAKPSERFANCLDRVGWDKLEEEVKKVL